MSMVDTVVYGVVYGMANTNGQYNQVLTYREREHNKHANQEKKN